MQTKLKGFWEKIKGFFAKLNKKTRILLGVCAAVVLVLIAAAAILLNRTEYELLQGGLNASEISSLVSFLDSNGVTQYKIDGDKVYVIKGRAQTLQGQLALSGNLTSGFLYETYRQGVGALNTSTEEERLWLIAREEKLAATIMQFEGIQWATVGITPGTERIYVLDPAATPATAEVTVTPTSRKALDNDMVQAIRDLVSHSVEGLEFSNVSVQDTLGNTYSQSDSTDSVNEASAIKLQYEEQISNKVRTQVLEALEYIYGPDNVRVAVNTTVDVNRKVINKTTYDQPEGSVVGGGLIGHDAWLWELINDGTEPVGGLVGTEANSDLSFPYYPEVDTDLTGDESYAGGQGNRDLLVNSTTQQEEGLALTITDVRVAVTINQNCENAGTLSTETLSSHVATAAGIGTETPQDYVSVVIAPFDRPADIDGVPGGILSGVPDFVLFAAIGGLMLFILLLILILILRGRAKKKREAQEQALAEEMQAAEALAAAEAAAAAAAPTGGADIMEINTEKSMELRKTVRQFAQNNPEIAAQMVKAWLRGDDNDG